MGDTLVVPDLGGPGIFFQYVVENNDCVIVSLKVCEDYPFPDRRFCLFRVELKGPVKGINCSIGCIKIHECDSLVEPCVCKGRIQVKCQIKSLGGFLKAGEVDKGNALFIDCGSILRGYSKQRIKSGYCSCVILNLHEYVSTVI